MSLKDQIIDKYWLEFVADKGGNEYWYHQNKFWAWFYEEIMTNPSSKGFKDYLK